LNFLQPTVGFALRKQWPVTLTAVRLIAGSESVPAGAVDGVVAQAGNVDQDVHRTLRALQLVRVVLGSGEVAATGLPAGRTGRVMPDILAAGREGPLQRLGRPRA
jgi:hypothetical protein